MTTASEPFSVSAFTTFGITSPSTLQEAPAPILPRDADAMYWMARYVEHTEHVARLLIVNSNLLINVGDLAPALQAAIGKAS